jgi:DNA-binding XRE family transcriptional regulator
MRGTIKQHRTWKGITQKEKADALGVVRQTYINWETRPMSLTIDKAFKIADILGVDINDIVFMPDDLTTSYQQAAGQN